MDAQIGEHRGVRIAPERSTVGRHVSESKLYPHLPMDAQELMKVFLSDWQEHRLACGMRMKVGPGRCHFHLPKRFHVRANFDFDVGQHYF